MSTLWVYDTARSEQCAHARVSHMSLTRAWTNLCFQARLIKTPESLALKPSSRTMVEAYLCGGGSDGEPAVLIDCAQPLAAQGASSLRALLAEAGALRAAPGAVAYRFNHVGRLAFAPGASVQEIGAHSRLAEAIVEHPDHSIEVLTDPSELGAVESQLARNGMRAAMRGVVRRAWCAIPLHSQALRAARGLLGIAVLDGVAGVYTDAAFADEVLAQV